jgi:hypothetical protein
MKAVLDAGALVAVDRRDRMIGARLQVLQQQGTPVRVSSGVVGQVWRDGRARDDDGYFTFVHRIFQEYFAARAVAERLVATGQTGLGQAEMSD